jgi:transposase
MQLSEHDLKQLDEQTIRSLQADRLQTLSLKLLADLKEARDRLNQSPDNSSRPPSTRAPWEGADTEQRDDSEARKREPGATGQDIEEGARENAPSTESDDNQDSQQEQPPKPTKKPPGKPGKPKGAKGHGRTIELAVTAELTHCPPECALCAQALAPDAPQRGHNGRHEIDIAAPSSGAPGLELTHTLHRYVDCQCECGHWTRAEPGRCADEQGWTVELTEWHLVGPGLVSLICALNLRLRCSRARIREFLFDWFDLKLCTATINQCIHEAGRAVAPVVSGEIEQTIRQAELVYADETGWKEHGRPLWLWVFTCATASLFVVGKRTREVVVRVLGEQFAHWLMSDGYGVYRQYDWRLRCLAHLIRKARGLEQSLEAEAHRFGQKTLQVLETLMEAVYAAREGPSEPPAPLRHQHAELLRELLALCDQHWDAKHEKTRELARELLNDWDTFWVVLDYPWLPLTNNEAERALRHWVIARRISYGTRTAQGSLAFALTISVIETCRKRGASPWPYLAEVIRRRRKGLTAPPLPQPAV